MGLEVFTEEFFATTAVEALSTEFRVVSDHAVAHLEPLDLGTQSRNDADGFMTRDQWELHHVSVVAADAHRILDHTLAKNSPS
jgi:hypothetical protein